MMNKKTTISQSNDDLAFAKARYEYCLYIYKNEQDRKILLEKKAEFYLSLITLFLGALVLKMDFIAEIKEILKSTPSLLLTQILYIVGSVSVFSLGMALFSVLLSVHVRGYFVEHPVDLISSLFNLNSEYLAARTDTELYSSTAKSYALATESDRIVNSNKSKWVQLSSLFLLISFLMFISAYGLVVYLKLQ